MDFIVRSYRESDKDYVIQLWKECELVVPCNDPQHDIERKQTVQSELFLIGLIHEKIIATAMVGYEGHRGWVNYLAVKPKFQNQGIGKQMMEDAERRLLKLGCPKLQVQIRNANDGVIKFYRKLGYLQDEVVNLGKRLISD
ncbi:MAG: GNAT family acetyltransferase [Candidatus Marinimicrobia bacterium]|nr:GNAT family acetyltransferase [Candidatus Neomarinimicrobiota bacterium]